MSRRRRDSTVHTTRVSTEGHREERHLQAEQRHIAYENLTPEQVLSRGAVGTRERLRLSLLIVQEGDRKKTIKELRLQALRIATIEAKEGTSGAARTKEAKRNVDKGESL